MWVLIIYVALMMVGGLIDVGIGSFVSSTWSDPVSLPVFLGCYFVTLWLMWRVAVKIAERLQLNR
ncbi:MAG TPA: hypothetical protein VMH84_19240 [Xanthobacteraceae bacterium]|nr:hypothetical protein [Xanthobacteraceae bacterium]